MTLILSLICLAAQDQTAEARKLLDAAAPPLRDPAYSQIEWEQKSGAGSSKGIGHFKRGDAWFLEQTFAKGGQVSVWDGKGFLQYMKSQNKFYRAPKDTPDMLLTHGGLLAEIHYQGNCQRLLKDAVKVTVKKEKLDDADCSHVTIVRKENGGATEAELHAWIDADKALKRYVRRWTVQGKSFESAYTYKVVDPPTTTDEVFKYTPPADAKDFRSR